MMINEYDNSWLLLVHHRRSFTICLPLWVDLTQSQDPSPSRIIRFFGRIDGEAISLQWLVEQLRAQELIIHDQRKEINTLKSSTYAKGV
jgi:hypothetical protein